MTTPLLPPGAPEFLDLFVRSRYSIFRLETLARYRGSGEDVALRAFITGGKHSPGDEMQDWAEIIGRNARAGCVMRRVHVVPDPLTEYLQFELCWAYPYSVAAGEDVRIISVAQGADWPVDVPQADFWLYDSHRLIDMHYNEESVWLGAEPVVDPARIVAANLVRDAAWHHAVPWREYVAGRPELAARVPAEVKASVLS